MGTRDVLEFPLEELEVPAAVKLMMQAATKCVGFDHEVTIEDFNPGSGKLEIPVDNDRLVLLSEKLENRFEDELEKVKAVRHNPVEEDAPNEMPAGELEGYSVHFVITDGDVSQVVVDGVIFGKLCNERVWNDPNRDGENTFCIKEFGHMHPVHEDHFGNEAP